MIPLARIVTVHKWHTLLVWMPLALLALGVPSGAGAQSDDERARLHFEAGRSYYDAGDYADALREFERSHSLSQRARLFFNISLSHERLGHLEEAVRFLERYLAEVEEIGDRATQERRLENLRARVAARAVAEEERLRREAELAEEERRLEEERQRLAAETTTTESPDNEFHDVDALEHDDGGIPTEAMVAFGAGAAGVVTGGLFGVMALSEQSDLEERCLDNGARCTEDDVSSLDTYSLLSDVGFGVAIVGAGVGLVLWLTDEDAGHDDTALQVTPWASRDGGGAFLGGKF